jgi:hypothetical protein
VRGAWRGRARSDDYLSRLPIRNCSSTSCSCVAALQQFTSIHQPKFLPSSYYTAASRDPAGLPRAAAAHTSGVATDDVPHHR